jgi:hypothetical protein
VTEVGSILVAWKAAEDWIVCEEGTGREFGHYATQAEAESVGVKLARKRKIELVVQNGLDGYLVDSELDYRRFHQSRGLDSGTLGSAPRFLEFPPRQIGRLNPELRRAHVAEHELLMQPRIAVDLEQQDGAGGLKPPSCTLDIGGNAQHLMQREIELAATMQFLNVFARFCRRDGAPGTRARKNRERADCLLDGCD